MKAAFLFYCKEAEVISQVYTHKQLHMKCYEAMALVSPTSNRCVAELARTQSSEHHYKQLECPRACQTLSQSLHDREKKAQASADYIFP